MLTRPAISSRGGYRAEINPRKHAISIYLFIYLFNFASQADRKPQQLAPITVALPNHDTQEKTDHNTGNYVPALLLATSVWVLLRPTGL